MFSLLFSVMPASLFGLDLPFLASDEWLVLALSNQARGPEEGLSVHQRSAFSRGLLGLL